MSEEMRPLKPYKGLMPYIEEDASFFFGREKEREIVIANLMASRLTLLYGPSGVGKSSVLRAGVAFQLRQQARQNLKKFGSPRFIVVEFSSWGDDPIRGMLSAVQTAISQSLEGKTIKPAKSNKLAQILKARTEDVEADLFIILDQFEEYFLYHEHEDGKGTFAVEFPDAVTQPDLRVNFLLSLRDDALAKLDRFKGRVPNLFDNYLRIEHLNQEAARAAIEKPLAEFNRRLERQKDRVIIEPELVKVVIEQVKMGQLLIGEVGRGQIGLQERDDLRVETPYLQLVMTRLWDEEMRAKSRVLRLKTLSRLGWASRIVLTHLDEVMRTLRPEVQQLAALVFNYLVTPSGTKIAYTVSDLASYAKISEPEIKTVLDDLASGPIRILRPIPAPPDQPHVQRYEIFHDVLATAILDWRARFLKAQEQADAKKQNAVGRGRLVGWISTFAIVFFTAGLALGVFSYIKNWWGVRAIYVANRNADKLDVVEWLLNKAKEETKFSDPSSPTTMRALAALRFAYELDPDPKKQKVKVFLDNSIIANSEMVTQAPNAPIELLRSNSAILKKFNQQVPYKPFLQMAEQLDKRAKRLQDSTTAVGIFIDLHEQAQNSSVSDTTLLRGYQNLLKNYSLYVDTVRIKQSIVDLRQATTKFEMLSATEKSDTATTSRLLAYWREFASNQRSSPELDHAERAMQSLENASRDYASIAKESDFVVCRNVANREPQGITDRFSPGSIYAWARVSAPGKEIVTFKWYATGKLFNTQAFTVEQNREPGYRVYATRRYGEDMRGVNEVRLYNSQNLLIGRRVFYVR